MKQKPICSVHVNAKGILCCDCHVNLACEICSEDPSGDIVPVCEECDPPQILTPKEE